MNADKLADALLPCPWCGEEPTLEKELIHFPNSKNDHWAVVCRTENCPAANIVQDGEMGGFIYSWAKKEAIAVWNDRAQAVLAEHAAQPAQAAQPEKPLFVLERWGFPVGSSPYRLERMPDGYWTPWHVAQLALMETRARMLYEFDKAREQAAQPVGVWDGWRNAVEKFVRSVALLVESAKQSTKNPNACFTDWRDVCALRAEIANLRSMLTHAPQPQAKQVGVSNGWVTMPREPTPEMLQAAEDADDDENKPGQSYSCIYSAMLAAAPQPPAQPSADAHDIAKRVREALDRQACPDHWMVLAYEAVVSALADSHPNFDSERNVRPGDIGTEHAPSADAEITDDMVRKWMERNDLACVTFGDARTAIEDARSLGYTARAAEGDGK